MTKAALKREVKRCAGRRTLAVQRVTLRRVHAGALHYRPSSSIVLKPERSKP
jgi:hypothetical protein